MAKADSDVVVVGGGTGSIGRLVVKRLVDEGRRVIVPTRHPLQVNDMPSGVTLLACDLSDSAAVEEFASKTETLGPWGALVNCSGGYAAGTAHQTGDGSMLEQLELNLLGRWRLAKVAARAMVEQDSGGRIVHVAARAALEVAPGQAAYQVSKAAIARLTVVMAMELRAHRIAVNAVLPGTLDTPANRAAMPSADHSRWVPVADAAAVIMWLLSPKAEAVSGALLPVYGDA